MTSEQKPEKPVRVTRPKTPSPSADFAPRARGPTPTQKHDAATRELIVRLEKENDRHLETIRRLDELVNRLAPENARLAADLSNAESIGIVSTIFVAIGGSVISYATFVGNRGPQVANIG